MDNELLKALKQAWGWSGLDPQSILAKNLFGNVLVVDKAEKVWRICPEELTCKIVADDLKSFGALESRPDFRLDWEMTDLIADASSSLGTPATGKCFCLKIPAILGGEYNVQNFAIIDHLELLTASGSMSLQIKDLPDGAEVKIEIED